MVVPLGFEPKLTVSKTAVLPLHHGTVAAVCLTTNRPFCESFLFRGTAFSFFTTKDSKDTKLFYPLSQRDKMR